MRRELDADATRTPQSRDKVILTFWSVPLFSRKGNSLVAVYRMRGIHTPYVANIRRSARVAFASRASRLLYELALIVFGCTVQSVHRVTDSIV